MAPMKTQRSNRALENRSKCVYVLNDAEIGLFSDEVLVNCAP
jgi:hypothetical protein